MKGKLCLLNKAWTVEKAYVRAAPSVLGKAEKVSALRGRHVCTFNFVHGCGYALCNDSRKAVREYFC